MADGRMTGIVAALEGSWLLQRSIDNGASMTGTAEFVGRGHGTFDYRECGRLRLADGHAIDAKRRYIFVADSVDGFSVLFAENPLRLFHRIALSRVGSRLAGRASHICAADRYDIRYEFRADGSFVVEHIVRGPRKCYAMTTLYARRRTIEMVRLADLCWRAPVLI